MKQLNSSVQDILDLKNPLKDKNIVKGDRYQKGETNIFFIRNTANVTEPLATLELKQKDVIQCRAKLNNKPSDEVVSFVNDCCDNYKFKSCFMREAV